MPKQKWISGVWDGEKHYSILHENSLDLVAKVKHKKDADLIAAAPKMLDMLYILLPYIEDLELDPVFDEGAITKLMNKLNKVIAEAEGADHD